MGIAIAKIIRTSRRSVSLEIASDAGLVIRAPSWITREELKRIVDKKEGWILRAQRIAAARNESAPRKKFSEGEKFLYLGKEYPLCIVNEAEPPSAPFRFDGAFFLSQAYALSARELFIGWYKAAAARIINQRIPEFLKSFSSAPQKVSITNASGRWGSCAGRARLNFSWRLVMAAQEIIDYVIVHELSHISEKNHSQRFWEKVYGVMPDYKSRRNWLKLNGHILTV